MKTLQASRKYLYLSSLAIGAVLLFSPAITISLAQGGSFTYTNPGEKAFMNVTNNASNSNFTIIAAGANGTIIPIVVNGTDTYGKFNISYIGGFQDLAGNTSYYGFLGNGTYGSNSTYGYFETTNTSSIIMAMLSSTYLITGSGANDTVNVWGGLTSDIYSVVMPGATGTVNLVTGGGSSTYAVQVGDGSVITIAPGTNATTGTTSVFNIVYENP